MKNLSMIIWLIQLGLNVAAPLAGIPMLTVWLMERFELGQWVLFCGIGLGIYCAIDGLRVSLKAMERMSRDRKKKNPPPLSFNNHD